MKIDLGVPYPFYDTPIWIPELGIFRPVAQWGGVFFLFRFLSRSCGSWSFGSWIPTMGFECVLSLCVNFHDIQSLLWESYITLKSWEVDLEANAASPTHIGSEHWDLAHRYGHYLTCDNHVIIDQEHLIGNIINMNYESWRYALPESKISMWTGFFIAVLVHQSADKSSIVPLGYPMKATQTLRVCRPKLTLLQINLTMLAALVH